MNLEKYEMQGLASLCPHTSSNDVLLKYLANLDDHPGNKGILNTGTRTCTIIYYLLILRVGMGIKHRDSVYMHIQACACIRLHVWMHRYAY